MSDKLGSPATMSHSMKLWDRDCLGTLISREEKKGKERLDSLSP